MPASTYHEILVSLAHNFTSDRLEQIAVPLSMAPSTDADLARRVGRLSASDFALEAKGLSVRLSVKLDEPLAQSIEAISDRIGVSVSEYLRAIFRIAIGQDAEALGTQDELDFSEHTGAREEARLAS